MSKRAKRVSQNTPYKVRRTESERCIDVSGMDEAEGISHSPEDTMVAITLLQEELQLTGLLLEIISPKESEVALAVVMDLEKQLKALLTKWLNPSILNQM